jgi:hypothetical protein
MIILKWDYEHLSNNVLQQERLEKEAEIRRVREELLRQQANQNDS